MKSLLLGVISLFISVSSMSAFAATINLSCYKLVWNQNFETMTAFSQIGVRATVMGTGRWVAHRGNGLDWFTFADPDEATGHPFRVGNGYLSINVGKYGKDPDNLFGGYSGGLLSSMDSAGKGFAQKYGYFEASMQVPGTPNTWPAFWMVSAPGLTQNVNSAEIDVTESYGNYTGQDGVPPGDHSNMGWHKWAHNGNHLGSGDNWITRPGMSSGFHLYGVDIEPTGIKYYFDRQLVWTAPIFTEAKQKMFVMINLALGGGTYNNAAGDGYDWSLTPSPTELKVRYVKVWASPNSPNYTGSCKTR